MDDNLLVLRLQGQDVRNGRIPTESFTGVLRRFAATLAMFERAFTGRRTRSTDLNVAALRRENPLVVGLSPDTRMRGYSPIPAVRWSIDEMERIASGMPPDRRIPLDALDNLIALSDVGDGDRENIAGLSATYETRIIKFDSRLASAARNQRREVLAHQPAPEWFSGMSKGSLVGDLRGVTDLSGEREFFIRTNTNGRSVRCIFPEEMRHQMNSLLFQPVKIEGYLRYEGASPHATLVEAINISSINEDARPHLFDAPGLFKDSYYPVEPGFPQ